MNKKLMAGVLLVIMLAVAVSPALAADDDACWGQATAAYAATGVMGEHASEQTTPRDGLRNLARQLYTDGVLSDDTLQALGEYLVSVDPDLTVEACMP